MTADRESATVQLISAAYGVAADPTRFDALLEDWDAWCDTYFGYRNGAFETINFQFEDAVGIADRLDRLSEQANGARIDVGPVAAVLLNEEREVLSFNPAASRLISQDEIASGIFAQIPAKAMVGRGDGPKSAYRIGGGPRQRTYLAVEAPVEEALRAAHPGAEKLLLISLLDWSPDFEMHLQETLNLSAAELKVARGLLEGLTAQETANQVGRSVETVRSHIKALLKKTGARRQTELVQFLTILRHVSDTEREGRTYTAVAGSPSRELVDVGSDSIEVIRYGRGRPMLYFTTSTRPEETREVREAFEAAGLHVIAPARPGFAGSPALRGDASEALLSTFLDTLYDLADAPPLLVGHREGGILAAKAAARLTAAGKPIAGLGLISTGAPVANVRDFERAPSNERRSFLAAQFARPALILGFKTATRLFRSSELGQQRIVRYFFSSSPIDSKLLAEAKYYQITRDLIAYSFENPVQIVSDIATWGRDWSDVTAQIAPDCPILFVHGRDHNFMPIEDVEAFVSQHAQSELFVVKQGAQLALYQAPRDIADELARHFIAP